MKRHLVLAASLVLSGCANGGQTQSMLTPSLRGQPAALMFNEMQGTCNYLNSTITCNSSTVRIVDFGLQMSLVCSAAPIVKYQQIVIGKAHRVGSVNLKAKCVRMQNSSLPTLTSVVTSDSTKNALPENTPKFVYDPSHGTVSVCISDNHEFYNEPICMTIDTIENG